MDHISFGNGVGICHVSEVGAYVPEAGVLGARAFAGYDETAVAGVVDAVVECGADGGSGIVVAACEGGLEGCGD